MDSRTRRFGTTFRKCWRSHLRLAARPWICPFLVSSFSAYFLVFRTKYFLRGDPLSLKVVPFYVPDQNLLNYLICWLCVPFVYLDKHICVFQETICVTWIDEETTTREKRDKIVNIEINIQFYLFLCLVIYVY